MRLLYNLWERGLWQSRLIILVAVLASVLVALGATFLVTIDVVYSLGKILAYTSPSLDPAARSALRLDVLSDIVGIVDGYLLATTLLIFALGLHELFIGNIAAVEQSPVAARLLHIRSIDDLKDKLGRATLLILVVKFFEQALELTYQSPLDLLALALGTACVGAALYFTMSVKKSSSSKSE